MLDALDALTQVPQHGDPVPANLPGREADEVVAIDWGMLGHGPVGADLGYYLLSAREEFEPLLDAYLMGLPDGLASRDEVALGARITAVYTVLTRAEWALARVATGEGALAAKYRHPAVAPHLRALQRQFPQIEALLGARARRSLSSMSRAVDDATTRVRLVLTGLLVLALASLVPSLQRGRRRRADRRSPWRVVALAAGEPIARLATGFGALAARTVAVAHATGREAPPVLSGRVTDPVHHPLRPRAPGSA